MNFETREEMAPRFIYLTGCDGTGKTTHAALLLDYLRQCGLRTTHVWLRFPFFLSLPLLVYARWRGFSWYEEYGGVRHGYWDFKASRLLRLFLPWTYLFDAAMFAPWKVYVPLLLGQTVVCERFVIDMLVDLALAFDDANFHKQLPGRWFTRLLPARAQVVVLDVDGESARARRADLEGDARLEQRLHMYRQIVYDLEFPVVLNQDEVTAVSLAVRNQLANQGETG